MTQPNRKRSAPRRSAKSDINVTPLIDVLLVLLVIFMVITPVSPVGLETNVPQPPPTKVETVRNDTLILSMDRSGAISLNQESMEFGAAISRLQDLFKTRQDHTLFVRGDEELLFNDIAQLIDAARGAGADRVGLLTEPIAAK